MGGSGLTPALARLLRQFAQGVHLARRATGRGLVEFYSSNNLTFASSIAYYSLLSLFPFMVLVLSVVSRLAVLQAGSEQAVVDLIERGLPRDFDFLSSQIVALSRTPIQLTIAGTLLSLWASMGVFSAVTSAVNHAWGVQQPYSYFQHKLVAFIMMIVAGLVFSVTLVVMGAVKLSEAAWFTPGVAWFPWIGPLSGLASRYGFLVASILGTGLVYYFLPNTKVRLRDVWFGAVLAAVLWRIALAGFGYYLREYSRFGVHGSVGTVVAFLVWVFVSAVILLYGVEVTAAYARLRQQAAET